jgi:hypothetical protein
MSSEQASGPVEGIFSAGQIGQIRGLLQEIMAQGLRADQIRAAVPDRVAVAAASVAVTPVAAAAAVEESMKGRSRMPGRRRRIRSPRR